MAVGEASFDVPESSPLLTAKQVATWLQISERTLYRRLRELRETSAR